MHAPDARPSPTGADEAAFIAAAQADDSAGFALLTERFRRDSWSTAIGCWRRTTTLRT